MLVVAGTIDVDAADRDAFLQGRRAAVAATLDEPGCREYAFSADLVDPGRVRVFEVWESAEDLDRHLALPAPRPAAGAAPAPGVVAAELLRYEVAAVSPLRA
ncbi:MAG TPA: putative quinol monooxygenase [Acidimicrobiales bacterium]|jgi:quinol monooxygenase YgiN